MTSSVVTVLVFRRNSVHRPLVAHGIHVKSPDVVVVVVVVMYLPPTSEHHRMTYVVEHIKISITIVIINPVPTPLFTNKQVLSGYLWVIYRV